MKPIYAESVDELLHKINSSDANVRYAAWKGARTADPSAIPPLADRLVSDDKGVVKAAHGALENIANSPAHRTSAGRPGRSLAD